MLKHLVAPLALALSVGLAVSAPNESTLTYQGYLTDGVEPLGTADTVEMRFRLYDADAGGGQVGPEVVKAPGAVTFENGLFNAEIDFGIDPFDGTQLWLEIEVDGDILNPRQKLTASAYSLSTRGITVDGDGDVGIGVDDPLNPLHVDGSIRAASFRAMGGGNTVNLFNPNNEGASFFLGWLNDVPRMRIGGSGANGGFDIQRIGDNSMFRIDGDSNVGISEANPDLRLTIDQQGLGIDDPASQTMSFHTNGAERMRITSDGKVAIGVQSFISASLDVFGGTASEPAMRVRNTAGSGARISGFGQPTLEVSGAGNTAGTGDGSEAVLFVSAGDPGDTTPIVARSDLVFGGDIAIFRYFSNNVARIDTSGRGFFNNGTQTGGADVAEWFDVEGTPDDYEPGDLLVISTEADRTVTRSAEPYCTLVAGVHATKPGVLLTERHVDADHSDMVPMGVVGVVPTKVSAENGPIRRGDLLVSSATPGHAMKGTDRSRLVGAIIGKALEDFEGPGAGVIRVMVTCK